MIQCLGDSVYIYADVDRVSDSGPLIALGPPAVMAPLRQIQEMTVNSSLIAFRIGSGEVVVHHDSETQTVFVGSAATGAFDVGAEGDHVVFAESYSELRLYDWTPESGTPVYYDPPDPVGIPMFDDGTLVWIQYMDFEGEVATRAELWTAPFVRDPAALEPRLVHPRVDPGQGSFEDGVYGWLYGRGAGSVFHLVDVPSGRERVLPVPAGIGCSVLFWVSSTEVVASCFDTTELVPMPYRFSVAELATSAGE
jgi:hypothetical protein